MPCKRCEREQSYSSPLHEVAIDEMPCFKLCCSCMVELTNWTRGAFFEENGPNQEDGE